MLPTAVCRLPETEFLTDTLPDTCIISHDINISDQITSKSSRHVISHRIISPTSPTYTLHFHHVFKQPFQSEKIILPLVGNPQTSPKVLSQNSCTKLGAEDWTQISQGPGWAPLIRSRGMRMFPLKLWPNGRGYEHPKICQLMVGVIVFFFGGNVKRQRDFQRASDTRFSDPWVFPFRKLTFDNIGNHHDVRVWCSTFSW